MSCDLHTHSTFSDGTSTPEELVSAAQELGLTAVALCDHNDVDGLPRFLEAARGGRTAAVPGTEISTVFEGTELHILGLFIPERGWEAVPRDRGSTSQRHHVPTPTHAGGEKMPDRTTACPCSAQVVYRRRGWTSTGA